MEDLKKLLAAATPGPWTHASDKLAAGNIKAPDNAALICAAVNALPELLAENERLRDLCDLAMPILEAAVEKNIPVTAEWTERLQSLHARTALKETGQ